MPWSGSSPNQTYSRTDGTRTGTTVWTQAKAASVNIVSADHDTHDQDVATALNLALKKDGGNAATADIPMGGNKLTNVGNAAARTQYPSVAQIQDGAITYVGTVGGSANAITLTNSGWTLSAYVTGQRFTFKAASANTSTTTVNIDGAGAKTIKRTSGADLSAGDLVSGAIIDIEYDGTNFQLLGQYSGGLVASNNLSDVASPIASYNNLRTRGSDVASASTLNLDTTTGDLVDVTGTTTITAITLQDWDERTTRFTGALTITNGASLVTLSGADIVTAAGDIAVWRGYASGVVRMVAYHRINGAPLMPKPATVPIGCPSNLVITVTGDAAATITADQVALWNSSAFAHVAQTVSLTLNASTTGANGLDTGSLANSTWYYLFVIYNPTAGTTACLASTSASSPTLPSGYTYKARVGAITTNSSAAFFRSIQKGREARYTIGTNPTALRSIHTGSTTGNVSTPTFTTTSVATFVPPTASKIALLAAAGSTVSATIMAAPNANYGAFSSATNPPPLVNATATSKVDVSSILMLLESTNIFIASNSSTANLYCLGWEDNL